MCRGVLFIYIVDVIGGYQRDVEFFSDSDEFLVDALQCRDGVPLDFQIKVFEGIFIPSCRLPGFIEPVLLDKRGEFAAAAGRKPDKALAVLCQEFPVYARPVVKTLEVGGGDKLDEIFIPGLVLRQQDEVVRLFIGGGPAGAAGRRQVRFAADDGFYPLFDAFVVELDCALHDAVVGYRQAVHPQFFGS